MQEKSEKLGGVNFFGGKVLWEDFQWKNIGGGGQLEQDIFIHVPQEECYIVQPELINHIPAFLHDVGY